MLDGSWAGTLGTMAALCSTGAFLPQVVRTWRRGGRDLSYGLLGLLLAGAALWLGYGLLVGAAAVVAANAVTFILLALVLFLKWRREGTALPPRGPRPRIAIDMDEVIADTLGHVLEAYNRAFGETLTRESLGGRSLEEVIPAERGAAVAALVLAPGFFRDIPVVAESQRVVRALCARYEVFIASAAMEVPGSFADKFEWLDEHFPSIPPSHRIFCGDKGVLDVDYLIDDSPRHFARFRGTPILFAAPHNRAESRFLRVSSWGELERLLLEPDAPFALRPPAPEVAPTA